MSKPFLFIGDSITDVGRRDDPEHLGDGYVRMIAQALPGRAVVNTGIGGDRVKDLRRRWDDDALAHDPQVLTIYVGINDTWRRYDSNDPTSDEAFAHDYRLILDSARSTLAAQLVLIEPFVTPVTADQARWHEDLDGKRAVVAQLAEEFSADFIPLHSLLGAAAEEHGPHAIAEDGVHPTPLGHRLIADAWFATVPLSSER